MNGLDDSENTDNIDSTDEGTDASDSTSQPDTDLDKYQTLNNAASLNRVSSQDSADSSQQSPDSSQPAALPDHTTGDPIPADTLKALGPQFLDQGDYSTAVTKLKDIYQKGDWDDKQKAADNYAQIGKHLKEYYGVPDTATELDPKSSIKLSHQLMDKNLTQEAKISLIEDWRTHQKEQLYASDPDTLLSAKKTESTIDAYASDFRRHVVAGNVGVLKDSVVRAAESALAPLAGTADLILGTELKPGLTSIAQDRENPDRDSAFTAKLASGVGSVAGFALPGGVLGKAAGFAGAAAGTVSAVEAATGMGYLGATIVDQGKSVYDTAYKETGSHEAAKQALFESSPGIALGAFADKIVGGSLGQLAKGEEGMLSALSGAATGAIGNVAQGTITSQALADATADDAHLPNAEETAKEALVGGLIGTAVGGLGQARERFKSAVDERTLSKMKAIEQVHGQAAENLGVTPNPENVYEESAFSHLIDKGDKNPVSDLTPDQSTTETVPDGALADAGASPLSHLGETLARPKSVPDSVNQNDGEVLADLNNDAPPPEKHLPISGGIPSPVAMELAKRLGGSIGIGNLDPRVWAFYNPAEHGIMMQRRLFKDLPHAEKTFAHELGHMVDFAGRRLDVAANLTPIAVHEEPVLHKLVRVNNILRDSMSIPEVNAEARALSAEWRPGWDGSEVPQQWIDKPPAPGTPEGEQYAHLWYRNTGTEMQADSFSAIFNDPVKVQTEYPKLWEAFQKGLDTQPVVKDFWKEAVDITLHPEKLAAWTAKRQEEGRMQHAQIAAKSAEELIANNKGATSRLITDAKAWGRRKLLDRFGVAFDIVSKVDENRDAAFKQYNNLYASLGAKNQMQVLFNHPIVTAIRKEWPTLGIEGSAKDPLSVWKDYETYNRIINETTKTIDNIKADNPAFHAAYRDIYDAIESQVGKKLKYNPLDSIGNDVSHLQGQELVDAFAKIHADVPQQIRMDIMQKMLAKNKLNAASVLGEDGFNVRRYLANPGATVRTAETSIAVLKQQLGDAKFKQLEDFSHHFHSIISSPLLKSLTESGVVGDDMLDRMHRNQDNWVNFNALKYFEKDPYFSGIIKQQTGNLGDIGDVLASTTAKAKAIYGLSEYQKAQNAAVRIARMGGIPMKQIASEIELKGSFKPGKKSIFETKTELTNKHPENSYLIEYDKGKPALYEMTGHPEFAKMFEGSSLENSPGVALGLRFIEGYNKILGERELKTIFSPVFVFRQKFYDRQREATVTGSLELPGLPLHTSGKLREVDSRGFKASRDLAEGKLNADVQHMVESYGIGAHFTEEAGGNELHQSVDDVVFGLMGVEIPKEKSLRSPAVINRKLNTFLEAFGLGKVKRLAEMDEARAKINMYNIAREFHGMGREEASAFARKYSGTPDPLGGGTEARPMSKLFLFGRAHLNGLRTEYELIKNNPKLYAAQYAYRRLIPRLLTSSALIAPLIGAMFGDEEEALTRKFLDKIPSFDKDTKMIIPLGFTDATGKFLGFDAKSGDIGPDHKASYLRLPYSHETINYDQVYGIPLKAIEQFAKDGTISTKQIGNNTWSAFQTVFSANVAPALQASARMGMLATGYNPYDFFRNKGIIPKDVQEAGTALQRSYEYLTWSMYNWAPGIFAFKQDKAASTDALTPYDEMARIPAAGALLKGFVGSSNYGDFEQGLAAQDKRTQMDASIRIDMGDNTKKLYNDYVKAQSMVTKLGKGWEQEVPQSEVSRVHALTNWHSRAYKYAFNEARASYEKGDSEGMSKIYENLESSSKLYRDSIK